jgi:RNA recognition motif-containing protein
MGKRLFVGNLPYSVDEGELEAAFAPFGTVVGAVVIRDRETGRSRGFGFVEMDGEDQAEAAQSGMNGFELGGRTLRVNEATERERRGE